MTNKRVFILLMAVLAVLILCACGDTSQVSSGPEGISTFGLEVDPSAQPSLPQTQEGQVEVSPAASRPATEPGGIVIEDNTGSTPKPTATPSPSPTATTTATAAPASSKPSTTRRPSTSSAPATSNAPAESDAPSESTAPAASTSPTLAPPGASSSPAVSPGSSPSVSPPVPASTATVDQVSKYRGRQLSELIADLGYPSSSEYEDVDEGDPNTDRIGTLYFDGFTVTTLRSGDSEVITAVVKN